jgi:zinc protease
VNAMTAAFSNRVFCYALAAAMPILALVLLAHPARATTVERVVSPGGIEAWLVHEPAVPLISVEFAFAGGSAQDPLAKAGTASLTASALNDSAGDLDSKAFSERLERKAIELSFDADRDHIRGSLRTLSENRDQAFDLLRLALTAPRFDAPDVEIDRGQMLSLLRRQSTSPNDIAGQRWWATAFDGHPYGRPVNGTLDSVPTISTDDMRAYAHRVLTRQKLKIAVVGDIDADTLKPLLDRVFGALPANSDLTPVENVTLQGSGRRIDVSLDVPQTVVDFGGPGIARQDPDFMAAYIVNHILGGGSISSRLYEEVREKRGLVYSVSDNLVWLDHAAVFIGSTATRTARAGETLDLIRKEIRRLAEEGPTQAELTEAKNYLNSSFALNLDTSNKIASLLVQLQLDGLGADYFQRRPEMIAAVTLDDARRVAKRLLDDGLLVTVVGKPDGVAATTAN